MVIETAEEKRMAANLQLQADLFLKKRAGEVKYIRPVANGINLVVVRKSSTKK